MARRSTTATPPPAPRLTGDALAGLGERGWNAVAGGGWKHTEHDITVHQRTPSSYLVVHAGASHELTSATGALCLVDMLIRRKTETTGA